MPATYRTPRKCWAWRCRDEHGHRLPLCWACRSAWVLGLASGPVLAGLGGLVWWALSRLVQ